LEAALIGAERTPAMVALDPIAVEGIFHSITTVGAMTESEDDAIELLEELREDIGEIEQGVVARHDQGLRPKRVVVLEGLSPLLASGRWLPEQVRPGRRLGAPRPRGRARLRDHVGGHQWTWTRRMLFFAPAGLTVIQAQAVWRKLPKPEVWEDLGKLSATATSSSWSRSIFSRPGPRVVDGVAMLAEIFDPEGFIDTSPPDSWTPLVE